jgi:uncharacterized integral membrane protein
MVQIIFNIIFLLILTSIIILNIGNQTTINLFFREFQDISVVVVVFLSFILGVLYAFCYAIYWKIRKKLRGGKPKKKEQEGKNASKDEAAAFQEEPPVPPVV